MEMARTPREVVDLQLQAYNAHDIEGYCALFAETAVLADLETGSATAIGLPAIRAIYTQRFAIPNLRCTVHARMELGDFAIDRETVTGLPGGPVEIIAIYEVRDGLIRSVKFVRQAASAS
jgi:hypothetical protein